MAGSIYDLRDFLDKLPAAPCDPKKEDPTFCSICERLNSTVAEACKAGKKPEKKDLAEEPKGEEIDEDRPPKPKEVSIDITLEEAPEDDEIIELEDEIPLVEGIHAKASHVSAKDVAIEVEPLVVQSKESTKKPTLKKQIKPPSAPQKVVQKTLVVKTTKPAPGQNAAALPSNAPQKPSPTSQGASPKPPVPQNPQNAQKGATTQVQPAQQPPKPAPIQTQSQPPSKPATPTTIMQPQQPPAQVAPIQKADDVKPAQPKPVEAAPTQQAPKAEEKKAVPMAAQPTKTVQPIVPTPVAPTKFKKISKPK